jgi:hypothetical protein
VGGSIGGAVVIAIAAVGVFFLRRQPPNTPSAAFVIDVPSHPHHEHHEPQKPMSDDGNHTRFSTVGTPIVPMRLYMRIFEPHVSILHSYMLIAFALSEPE